MTKKKKLCVEQFLSNQQWRLATVLSIFFFMLTVEGNCSLVPDFLGQSQFHKAPPEVVPSDKRIHEWEREKNFLVDGYILMFRLETYTDNLLNKHE